MNEWAGVPTARELEAEFGVRVMPPDGRRFGYVVATLPGGAEVCGEDLADLRDELIKHQRRTVNGLNDSGPQPGD